MKNNDYYHIMKHLSLILFHILPMSKNYDKTMLI